MQAQGTSLELLPDGPSAGQATVLATGSSTTIGKWAMHLDSQGMARACSERLAGKGSHGKQTLLPHVAGIAVRYLGVATPHFHNLTDLVREALSEPVEVSGRRRGRPGGERHRLPDAVDAAPNVAVFQITAELPLSLDLVFTGSLPAGVRAMQGLLPL